MGPAVTVLEAQWSAGHASAWDFSRVPESLILHVIDRLLKGARADARDRVLPVPAQSQDVPRLTASGVAAAAFEELHEPGQRDARPGADEEMDVGLKQRDSHDLHSLLGGNPSEVLVEELAGMAVDHRLTVASGPGEVKVDLMGSQRGSRLKVGRCASALGPGFSLEHILRATHQPVVNGWHTAGSGQEPAERSLRSHAERVGPVGHCA